MSADVFDLWVKYNEAKANLCRELGSCLGVTEAFSAQLVADAYQGKRAESVDGTVGVRLPDGRLAFVRAVTLLDGADGRTDAIRDWSFDVLFVVLFDNAGNIVGAYELASNIARRLAVFDDRVRGWVLDVSKGSSFSRADVVAAYCEARLSQVEAEVKESTDDLLQEPVDRLETMRNKQFAITCINLLKEQSETLDRDLNALLDPDYCRQVVKHSIAVLKRATGLSRSEIAALVRDSYGNRRYYESTIIVGNESYVVSNDWYGLGVGDRDNRTPFLKWVRERVSE